MRRLVTVIGVIGVLAASFVTAETAQGVDATATPDVSVMTLADATFGFPNCTDLVSQHATFRFTRTDTTGSLAVTISTSGTAITGQDYTAPASVTFPDGVATVDLSLDGAPSRAFYVPARTRSVTMTIDAGSGYTVGNPASADASITYVVPPPCPPATFTSSPVNSFQTVAPNQLPEILVVNPAPPGTTFIYFPAVTYPAGVPDSWYPPPGLGWAYQQPDNLFKWLWQQNDPPKTPITLAVGSHSFNVIACAYYQPISIYYGPVNSGVESSSCTTIKFNLNVESAGTGIPSFTG